VLQEWTKDNCHQEQCTAIEGTRNVGRQPERWIDNIKDDIAYLGLISEQQRTEQKIEENGHI